MVYGLVQFSRSHSTAHVSVLEHGMEKKFNVEKYENRAQALRCTLVPDFAILSRQTPSSE